jgi:hypothetical protein
MCQWHLLRWLRPDYNTSVTTALFTSSGRTRYPIVHACHGHTRQEVVLNRKESYALRSCVTTLPSLTYSPKLRDNESTGLRPPKTWTKNSGNVPIKEQVAGQCVKVVQVLTTTDTAKSVFSSLSPCNWVVVRHHGTPRN